MLKQYAFHILGDPVLSACTATMLCLFAFDFFTLFGQLAKFPKIQHTDFKSPIMSIGIFGTFLGILSGLYGFTTEDISKSVPILLEGLKFAFVTSVLGMLFTVILSILHKLFGKAESESHLLQSIDQKMGSLDATMRNLAKTIESPTELVKQFSEMKTFLRKELLQINATLDKALEELGRGATKEVIRALENVITEFNSNLQEQFGENFKQLNAACLKMVEWQDRYKDHVDSAEKYLAQIHLSLDDAASSASKLVESYAETKRICDSVAGLIQTYDLQIQTLESYLQSCKRLGEEARTFLVETEQALTLSSQNMNSFSDIIEDSVSKQSAALSELTRDLETQVPKALGELEDVLTRLTSQFAEDYKSLFQFVVDKR